MRTLFVLISLCSVAAAAEYRGPAGTLHAPDDTGKDEVLPVLVVEKGLAKEAAKLWPALSARMRLAVLETPRLRGASADEVGKAVLAALGEAEEHLDVDRCPVVLLGFSAAGPAAECAFANPDRFRGLILVNTRVDAAALPAPARLLVGVLHGRDDPVVPAEHGEAAAKALAAAGQSVRLRIVPATDHTAPLGPAGADFLAEFLRTLGRRTVRTESKDGLPLVADLYETGSRKDPVLLLFHQARSSRGEYRKIAPRLLDAGWNCLALDQRSGNERDGVANETAAAAEEAGKPRGYVDAKPDLVRALSWARELGFSGKLAIWGSSYSAALSIFVGAEEEGIDAVLSFSPGDYLPPRGAIFGAAKELTVPTLVVCPPNEESRAKPVFEAVAAEKKELYVHPGGVHGSSTLYRSESAESAWKRVLAFLEDHLR